MTTPEQGSEMAPPCPCGQPATTTVEVDWSDGKRRYRYCAECAEDITETCEGTEVLP